MAKTETTPEAESETDPDTTIEQLKAEPATLADQLRRDELAKREDAADRYRELLRRNDQAQAGDAAAARDCMTTLGRKASDLADDLELVAVLDAMDAARCDLAEVGPQLNPAVQRLHAAREAYAAERDEVHDRHAKLIRQAEAVRSRVGSRLDAANRIIGQPGRHKVRWAAILEGRVVRFRFRPD